MPTKKRAKRLIYDRDWNAWACFNAKTGQVYASVRGNYRPISKPPGGIGPWVRVKYVKVE